MRPDPHKPQAPEVLIHKACQSITQQDCMGYMAHCGAEYGSCYESA